ncbi:hypothetical protein E2986_02143 [Frieseomelitta varia]|uniref:Uncharacterized protein n=1 Tax=Frieseomelitta varia TaxID=561572 RepID=A0A833VJ93_9HYME|nr:hypothetical protein E2986_02143 [Frieseomelitta varia]
MFKLITPYDSDEDLAFNNKETKSENTVSSLGNKNISNKIATVISNNDTGGIKTNLRDNLKIVDRHAFELECIQNSSITAEKKHKEITNVDKANEKEKVANFMNSHRQFCVENLGKDFIIEKKKKNSKIKIKKLGKKEKLITFDNINNKSDLKLLLNRTSYPGLDKLQWNISWRVVLMKSNNQFYLKR